MHKIKLLIILSYFFSCFTFANENQNIDISNVWVSEAPPTVTVLAAYAKIKNISSKTQILTTVSSPQFSKIELHLSKVVNEMATMEKQDSLAIPANETVELSPGSFHLMLFNPQSPLKSGNNVLITFTFVDGTSVSVNANVKKRSNDGHEHHHHNH
jgi:periplasmic copper chaperone A